jgi:hypothetical protein
MVARATVVIILMRLECASWFAHLWPEYVTFMC